MNLKQEYRQMPPRNIIIVKNVSWRQLTEGITGTPISFWAHLQTGLGIFVRQKVHSQVPLRNTHLFIVIANFYDDEVRQEDVSKWHLSVKTINNLEIFLKFHN